MKCTDAVPNVLLAKRQLRAIRNAELRERVKESDQLRCFKLWLRDSEVINLTSELQFDDDVPDMTKEKMRKMIKDFAASIVRKAIRSRWPRSDRRMRVNDKMKTRHGVRRAEHELGGFSASFAARNPTVDGCYSSPVGGTSKM
jgi:hypothetical protein